MAENGVTMRDAIETARAEIADAAPDAETAVEGEAYLMRQVASVLADNLLAHLAHENGLTRTRPTKGGPNPDYVMFHAGIDPQRGYRIEGRLEKSERVGVGAYAFTPDGQALLRAYASFDSGNVAPDGRFALDMCNDASGPNGLKITPDSRALIVRILHRDDSASLARIALHGAPAPTLPPRCDQNALDARAGQMLLKGIRQFLQWTQLIGEHPNRFIKPPPEIAASVQGDPDTFYRFAYFDLGPDDTTLTATIPIQAGGYWSLHAYNHWLEVLPGAGIGDRDVRIDAERRCEVTIAAAPTPRASNSINTQGRQRGILIYRAIGSDEEPSLSTGCISG